MHQHWCNLCVCVCTELTTVLAAYFEPLKSECVSVCVYVHHSLLQWWSILGISSVTDCSIRVFWLSQFSVYHNTDSQYQFLFPYWMYCRFLWYTFLLTNCMLLIHSVKYNIHTYSSILIYRSVKFSLIIKLSDHPISHTHRNECIYVCKLV